MRSSTVFLTLILCLSAVPRTSLAELNCRFSAERTGGLPVAGVTRVRIEAGAGDLTIRGREGAVNVTASGRACSNSEELVAATQLHVTRDGDVLVVATELPEPVEHKGLFGLGTDYATLDLEVEVPAALPLDVEDSSGDLELDNTAATTLADSSGDISIHGIAGDLAVTDSSGDIDISEVRGNLRLSDSSGDIEIVRVTGNVTIPVDSSGDIDIRHVDGTVHIETDTSGDVDVADVGHDVTIDVDSSGGIKVARIGGAFTVGADASGDIKYTDVKGAVTLPRRE
jgi:Toastrack DUF4097